MPHDPKPIPSFDAASAPRSPRCHALIPCAGSGSRSGRTGPKQYEQLAGQRLVDHTLAAFLALPQLASIALVVAPDDDSLSSPDPRVQLLRVGGASRAASVHNGLRALLLERDHHLPPLAELEAELARVHGACCEALDSQVREVRYG